MPSMSLLKDVMVPCPAGDRPSHRSCFDAKQRGIIMIYRSQLINMKRYHGMKLFQHKGRRCFRAAAVAVIAASLIMAGSPLMAGEPSFAEEVLTIIRAKMNERQNRRNMRKGAVLEAFFSRTEPSPEIWTMDHPSHRRRLAQFSEKLRGTPRSDTIAFGDSLLDMTRTRLRSVPDRMNFSTSGTWAHHMARMAADIRPELMRDGHYQSVKYVVVGSLGGNPLLMRQPVDVTITRSCAALDSIRSLYLGARIIVFGLPPTVSLYVNMNAIPFEAALYQWVLADRDAVLLPLQRHFAGSMGIFPRADMTVDGVHFSERGALEFDRLIERAKKAPSRSVID